MRTSNKGLKPSAPSSVSFALIGCLSMARVQTLLAISCLLVNLWVSPVMAASLTTCNKCSECGSATEILVTDSVVTYEAFQNCSHLQSVTFDKTVISVGAYAFQDFFSLNYIFFGTGVRTIGEGAFGGSNLTSVIIPDSVTSLGDNAFAACFQLQTVKLGAGVSTIGSMLFMMSGLLSVTIPDTVTSIGRSAFQGNLKLAKVRLGAGVLAIGESAFEHTALTSVIIPNQVKNVAARAFYDCAALAHLSLGSAVTAIGASAFQYTALKSVHIPANVHFIGHNAFGNVQVYCDQSGISKAKASSQGSVATVTASPTGVQYSTYMVDVAQTVGNLTKATFEVDKKAAEVSLKRAIANNVIGLTSGEISDIKIVEIPVGECSFVLQDQVLLKYQVQLKNSLVTLTALQTQLTDAARSGNLNAALQYYAVQYGAGCLFKSTLSAPSAVIGRYEDTRPSEGASVGVLFCIVLVVVLLAAGLYLYNKFRKLTRGTYAAVKIEDERA